MRLSRLAFAGLLATAAVAASAAQPDRRPAVVQSAQPGINLTWPEPPQSARYRVGNILLGMRNQVNGTDSAVLDRVLTVEAPGFPAFTIDSGEDDDFGPSVMVVETPSGTPMILFQTFSGGAHCCTTVTAIVPQGGRLIPVEVYQGDGGPIDEAPRDVDGDGVVDIVRYDNAFLYTFASYAESYAPSVIYNVVDGRVVDVSTRPGFRSLFEEDARQAREACLSREGNPNGACAAYVAAAARIGTFDTAWREMLAAHKSEAETWPLPTGYSSYPEALRAFLAETGYLPPR